MVPVTLQLFVLLAVDRVKLLLSLAKFLVQLVALPPVLFAQGFGFGVVAFMISITGLLHISQLLVEVL